MGCAGGNGAGGWLSRPPGWVELAMWPLTRLTQPWHTKGTRILANAATLRG